MLENVNKQKAMIPNPTIPNFTKVYVDQNYLSVLIVELSKGLLSVYLFPLMLKINPNIAKIAIIILNLYLLSYLLFYRISWSLCSTAGLN